MRKRTGMWATTLNCWRVLSEDFCEIEDSMSVDGIYWQQNCKHVKIFFVNACQVGNSKRFKSKRDGQCSVSMLNSQNSWKKFCFCKCFLTSFWLPYISDFLSLLDALISNRKTSKNSFLEKFLTYFFMLDCFPSFLFWISLVKAATKLNAPLAITQ